MPVKAVKTACQNSNQDAEELARKTSSRHSHESENDECGTDNELKKIAYNFIEAES